MGLPDQSECQNGHFHVVASLKRDVKHGHWRLHPAAKATALFGSTHSSWKSNCTLRRPSSSFPHRIDQSCSKVCLLGNCLMRPNCRNVAGLVNNALVSSMHTNPTSYQMPAGGRAPPPLRNPCQSGQILHESFRFITLPAM